MSERAAIRKTDKYLLVNQSNTVSADKEQKTTVVIHVEITADRYTRKKEHKKN